MSIAGAIILLVGDSWMTGPAGAALADAMRAEGATVVVDGVVGRSANSLVGNLRTLLDEVGTVQPTHVVIVLGVNDTVGQRTHDSYVTLRSAIESAGPEVWILSNATMPDSTYRTKVQAIEVMQRDVFGSHAIAGATFADATWFDSTGYHLTPTAAPAWVALVEPMLARMIDGQSGTLSKVGRALLKTLPFADRFFS